MADTPSLAERLETRAAKMQLGPAGPKSKLAAFLYECAADLRRLEGELSARHDAQDLTRSQRDSYQAENARLREALERIDGLTRIEEAPPSDHVEGTCIDCEATIDYAPGLEATEPERCNNCHATWSSLRMTDCGSIARAALAPAKGGEEETKR